MNIGKVRSLSLISLFSLLLSGCSSDIAREEKKPASNQDIYAEKNILLVDGKPAKDILFEGNIYSDGNGGYYFMDCRNMFKGLLTENTYFSLPGAVTTNLENALPTLKEKANMVATFAWGYDYSGKWINPFPGKQENSMPEEVHVLMVGFSTIDAITSFRNSEEKGSYNK